MNIYDAYLLFFQKSYKKDQLQQDENVYLWERGCAWEWGFSKDTFYIALSFKKIYFY